MSEESGDTDQSEVADSVFRVLSDPYRRLTLYYLTEQKSTTVEKLATVLTGWKQAREDDSEIATPSDRKRIRIALQHVHLPTIEDEGFVRYDPESGEVTLETVPELLETIIERSLADERQARDVDVDSDGNDLSNREFGGDDFDSDNFDGGDSFGTDREYSEDE